MLLLIYFDGLNNILPAFIILNDKKLVGPDGGRRPKNSQLYTKDVFFFLSNKNDVLLVNGPTGGGNNIF